MYTEFPYILHSVILVACKCFERQKIGKYHFRFTNSSGNLEILTSIFCAIYIGYPYCCRYLIMNRFNSRTVAEIYNITRALHAIWRLLLSPGYLVSPRNICVLFGFATVPMEISRLALTDCNFFQVYFDFPWVHHYFIVINVSFVQKIYNCITVSFI